MTKDLTAQVDKPLWPLSSYGPAKQEPNLLSGLDESPEELRVRAVTALRAGNANEYVRHGKLLLKFQTLMILRCHTKAAKSTLLRAFMLYVRQRLL
jgi:hypothetical protein